MDETHQKLENEGKKGGSTTTCYTNPTFSRARDRVTKSSHHTTGVYATNLLEVLPPLYIFNTKSKNENNYKIDPLWCRGLPKVSGKFGRCKKELWNSFVACRPKGSMDVSLFEMFCTKVILPCYPNVLPTIEQDDDGGIIKGPLFLKVDSGPGRLSNEAMNLEFREKMWDIGFYIFLGLPNGTKCTQEMDQGYQTFKPATDISAIRVDVMKMARRVDACKKAKLNKAAAASTNEKPASDTMSEMPPLNTTLVV